MDITKSATFLACDHEFMHLKAVANMKSLLYFISQLDGIHTKKFIRLNFLKTCVYSFSFLVFPLIVVAYPETFYCHTFCITFFVSFCFTSKPFRFWRRHFASGCQEPHVQEQFTRNSSCERLQYRCCWKANDLKNIIHNWPHMRAQRWTTKQRSTR